MTQPMVALLVLIVLALILGSLSRIAEQRAALAESTDPRSGESHRAVSQQCATWSVSIFGVVVVRIVLVALGFTL